MNKPINHELTDIDSYDGYSSAPYKNLADEIANLNKEPIVWGPEEPEEDIADLVEEITPEPHPLEGKKVLVTGGTGFLGRFVVEILKNVGAVPVATNSKEYDLTQYEHTRSLFNTYRPDCVIHCAGFNGGIEFNRLYPAEILDKNVRMALNVHKVAQEMNTEKVLSIITSCAYPDGKEIIGEESLWDGLPNETIRGHGLAKRMLQACAEQYHKQYGLNAVCVAVTNLYGPFDTFDLTRTKVVGAVIRKVVEAYQSDAHEVEFWGTGKPKRQLMFVRDAACAIVEALAYYEDHTKPLNIGVDTEVSIKDLVEEVVYCVEYEGKVFWNKEKGDGQMRKMLDIHNMEESLIVPQTEFSDGIQETVAWYINNKQEADKKK